MNASPTNRSLIDYELPPLLTPATTAQIFNLTTKELEQHRHNGTAPEYHHIGHGTIRYNTTAVRRWQPDN